MGKEPRLQKCEGSTGVTLEPQGQEEQPLGQLPPHVSSDKAETAATAPG